jgi:hypothetical protein
MVPAFFDNRCVIYMNHVPWWGHCYRDYILAALKEFLKALCLKRPDLVPKEQMFH